MAECRDLESLFASVRRRRGAATCDCAAVDAHLRHARRAARGSPCERAVREALVARREGLRACAPRRTAAPLRRRAHAAPVAASRRPLRGGSAVARRVGAALDGGDAPARRRGCVPLRTAAAEVPALAAQLVVDHVKCFEFAPQPAILPDARALSREWSAARGWEIKVPESTAPENLELSACAAASRPRASPRT